jgi:hypothetical protein
MKKFFGFVLPAAFTEDEETEESGVNFPFILLNRRGTTGVSRRVSWFKL